MSHKLQFQRFDHLFDPTLFITAVGFGKVKGKRIPLSDNMAVEEHLGEHGMICIEDLGNFG